MPKLRLFLFGMPRLEMDGQVVKVERCKAIALIAYLAMNPQPQSRDVLAALFWPESNHDQARAALRSTLSTLSTVSDVRWIEANRTNIALNPDAISIDAVAFRDLLKTTNALLVNHGLLEPVSGGRFQMHTLLMLHAKSLLQTEFGG